MPTEIRLEPWCLPAAPVGENNPLPDLRTVQYVHSQVTVGPGVSPEEKKYIGYGMVDSILPYQIQDGYGREQKPRSFRAAVLENDRLRAVFLPELGGRLVSLYHKEEKRELLHVNPVFQPCHLALRNAWFSGGVEWNVSLKGHSPYTCAPLHAEIAEGEGMRVLRLYEYERIRRAVYCLEAYLPDDSQVLYVKTRIANTAGEQVPMYWWSNIAVDETPGTRVLAPADAALECYYSGTGYQLDRASMPHHRGVDCSYPTHLDISTDYFYCVPKTRKKWVCALEKDGRGLFETSTDNLRGKKIFQWGMRPGGRHWQEFLARPGSAYIEIQSGLARTQLEHIPMDAGETWEFVEAFGLARCDAARAHGDDWPAAQAEAERAIDQTLRGVSPQAMRESPAWRALSQTPGTPLLLGSGWGALENMRREKLGQPPLSAVYAFSRASLTAEQGDFISLLETGALPDRPVSDAPRAYMADRNWLPLLSGADGWAACLQRGVTRYALGDAAGAEADFLQSERERPNAWARRNLSRLAFLRGERESAEKWMLAAVEMLPWEWHLAAEAGAMLNEFGHSARFLRLYETLPADVRRRPRLIFQRVIALGRTGKCREAEKILEDGYVLPDIREGEASLADVWEEIQRRKEEAGLPRKALPYDLDFRMH